LQDKTKRVLGMLSIITVIINIIFFFLIRGPEANLIVGISVFTGLSVVGVIFASLSKKIGWMIGGIVLNLIVLIFAYLLLLAVGISGA